MLRRDIYRLYLLGKQAARRRRRRPKPRGSTPTWSLFFFRVADRPTRMVSKANSGGNVNCARDALSQHLGSSAGKNQTLSQFKFIRLLKSAKKNQNSSKCFLKKRDFLFEVSKAEVSSDLFSVELEWRKCFPTACLPACRPLLPLGMLLGKHRRPSAQTVAGLVGKHSEECVCVWGGAQSCQSLRVHCPHSWRKVYPSAIHPSMLTIHRIKK